MENNYRFIAFLKEEYCDSIDLVAEKLQEAGCIVDKKIPLLGTIRGRTESPKFLQNIRLNAIAFFEPDTDSTTL